MIRGRKKLLALALGFNAFTAISGGIALMTGVINLPLNLLTYSPFSSFFIPGVILLVMVGGSSLLALSALVSDSSATKYLAEASGVIMIGWIISEVILIRAFSWWQLLYLMTGYFVYYVASHPRETIKRI